MNFLNPAILFGLFAASIPLILHLLHLRKLKRIEFSSLKFIKELQKTKIRKIRLKQVILLILRTLIIVFIVLAFARPTVKSELPLLGTYAKTDAVILLDNSFSMDVSDEFGNRFKQAKEVAANILRTLKQGDKAVIIPMSGGNLSDYTLSGNLVALESDLTKVKISYTPASFINAVSQAYHILAESDNLNREIYLISDGQKNMFDFGGESFPNLYEPHTSLNVINIGEKSKMQIENYSVDSLQFVTQIFRRGMPVDIRTTIRNNSSKDVKGLVTSLFFNVERKAQTALDIEHFRNKMIDMTGEPKQFGVVEGYVVLENDALDYDNKRYFGFFIPGAPRIALFGNSEAKLIETVLNLNDSQIEYQRFNTQQITSVNLDNFDLIIISNGVKNSGIFERVKNYVESGGNILLFANKDGTDFNSYARGLNTLGITTNGIKNFSGTNPVRFDYTDKLHPVFKGVFKGSTDNKKQVETPDIMKIISTKSGQKIISTPAGNFLSEIRLGKGKIFFVSSALDPAWNNFPQTGLFPVLIYRSVFYLTAKENTGITAQVGENKRIVLSPKYANYKKFKIIDPNGLDFFADVIHLPSSVIVELNNLKIPGVYVIQTNDGKVVDLITVNNIPSESIIAKRSENQVKNDILKFIDKRTTLHFMQAGKITQLKEKARTGTELWQLFVLLAILTALAEMLVAHTSKNEIISE